MSLLKKLRKVVKKVDPIGSKLIKADPVSRKVMGSDKKRVPGTAPSASVGGVNTGTLGSRTPMNTSGSSAMNTARTAAGARSGVGRLQKIRQK